MLLGTSTSIDCLSGMSKARHIATRACSIETEASPGGPMTSPAASMPSDVV